MTILRIDQLTMKFGGLTAVNTLDIEVKAGQIFSIIGPNGAGKTTVFNAITGIYDPSEGDFYFEGSNLVKKLNGKTIALFAAVGLFVGFLMLGLWYLESLWKAAVVNLYEPTRPYEYSYTKAFDEAWAVLMKNKLETGFVFLAAFAVGALGAYAIWQRSRRTTFHIARSGIARTFQNIRLFREMTVLENVLISMDRYMKTNLVLAALVPWKLEEEKKAEADALEFLKFVGLEHRAHALAGSLPYGEQRRLEIARAMATRPKLLLLDEPAAGMNPTESLGLMELIKKIRERGITILLIEHHMKVVMGISDQIVVLDHGAKISEGDPAKVSKDTLVLEAYLGREDVH